MEFRILKTRISDHLQRPGPPDSEGKVNYPLSGEGRGLWFEKGELEEICRDKVVPGAKYWEKKPFGSTQE